MSVIETKRYTLEELLAEKGYIVYTNVGCSMMPLLRERRDIIEIRPAEFPIRKYQVALYKRGDQYILHRCISSGPSGYVFAGDHNTFKERDVTEAMILGVMTRVIRGGKDIRMDDPRYRIYAHLWVDFFPVRVMILRAKSLLRKLLKPHRPASSSGRAS